MTFLEHISNLLQEERGVNKLFHSTNLKNIASIILHNKMVLTYVGNSDEGDDAADIISERPGHYNFYVSMSRIPFGGYNYDKSENLSQVIIEFNADRLRQNYKIVPFNYFHRIGGYDPIRDRSTDENEDRIISNKSQIPNIVRYIDKINFYLPRSTPVTHEYILMFNEMIDAGIKFEIYFDIGKFKALRSPDFRNEIPAKWQESFKLKDDEYRLRYMPKERVANDDLMMLLDFMVYGEKSRWYEKDIAPIYQTLKTASDLYYAIEIYRTAGSSNYKKLLEMLSATLRKRKINLQQFFDETKEKVLDSVKVG